MAGVTIIKSGYTDQEIEEIKRIYEPLGFTVTVVGDMEKAVDSLIDKVKNWR